MCLSFSVKTEVALHEGRQWRVIGGVRDWGLIKWGDHTWFTTHLERRLEWRMGWGLWIITLTDRYEGYHGQTVTCYLSEDDLNYLGQMMTYHLAEAGLNFLLILPPPSEFFDYSHPLCIWFIQCWEFNPRLVPLQTLPKEATYKAVVVCSGDLCGERREPEQPRGHWPVFPNYRWALASERLHLKKSGGKWCRKTRDAGLWPPHMLTRAHALVHTRTYMYPIPYLI